MSHVSDLQCSYDGAIPAEEMARAVAKDAASPRRIGSEDAQAMRFWRDMLHGQERAHEAALAVNGPNAWRRLRFEQDRAHFLKGFCCRLAAVLTEQVAA